MGFGFSSDLKDSGPSLMLAGINRRAAVTPELAEVDTFITKLEFVPGEGDTAESLRIEMADSQGRTLDHRYFDPTKGEYASEKNQQKFLKVAANLGRKFLGESYSVAEQPTFEAFCRRLIQDIGNRYRNVPLRTKVVYNAKGYPKLPGYAPIWELASVPESESKLVINPRFDNVVPGGEAAHEAPTVLGDDIFGKLGASEDV